MGRVDEIAAMRELGVAWCTEAQFAALLDERDRLLADVERLATEMEAFQPGGEMGPLFAAGQAHAYRDAARHLRELISRESGGEGE